MNRALIVIDVQESFRQRPNWAATSDLDEADKVARLV
ncbi:MAG: cysteine hydrolase, partial [Glycomyces artemisiae]|nr:cysteine hydrolase [Glycomyces artemisiae]